MERAAPTRTSEGDNFPRAHFYCTGNVSGHLFLRFSSDANSQNDSPGNSSSCSSLHFSSRFIRLLQCPRARFSFHWKPFRVLTGFKSVIQMVKIILNLIYSHTKWGLTHNSYQGRTSMSVGFTTCFSSFPDLEFTFKHVFSSYSREGMKLKL